MSKNAILVQWPDRMENSILDDVLRFTAEIKKKVGNDKLVNYTPAYNSILLQYSHEVKVEQKRGELLEIYNHLKNSAPVSRNCWHIPVCYDQSFAPDLSLFEEGGMSVRKLIQMHTKPTYRVYMIGFLPGFLYLGKLSEDLRMDRKKEPRRNVSKGSVGIAGSQTGIYPINSPGGWQIIGRTPLTLFDLNSEIPTPIQQGDDIKFYEIDLKTYNAFDSH